MAKHYVAKYLHTPRRWNYETKEWIIGEPEWRLASNRYTFMSNYKSPRTAITTNWGTQKDPKRVKVFVLDTDDMEPWGDPQARMEWAERMMLKCGAIFDEVQREQRSVIDS